MKKSFNVTGMGCAMCVAAVEKAVSALDGINEVNVSLIENAMTVDYNDDLTNDDIIIEAVTKAGYGASLAEDNSSEPEKKKKRRFF